MTQPDTIKQKVLAAVTRCPMRGRDVAAAVGMQPANPSVTDTRVRGSLYALIKDGLIEYDYETGVYSAVGTQGEVMRNEDQ